MHASQPLVPSQPPLVLDDLLARMAQRQQALADRGDAAEIFLFTYGLLTRQVKGALATARFADPDFMLPLAFRFAELYFDAEDAFARNPMTCPRPWRAFFAVARDGRATMLEILCLGMNAHIVHDLPLALAAQMRASGDVLADDAHGLRLTPRLPLRQFDHEMINELLKESIDLAQDEIARRFVWWLRVVDGLMGRVDEWLIDRLLREARMEVWSNACALAVARTRHEEDAVRRHLVELAEENVRRIDIVNLLPLSAVRRLAHRFRPDFSR